MALYSQLIPAAASQKTSSITIPAALSVFGINFKSLFDKNDAIEAHNPFEIDFQDASMKLNGDKIVKAYTFTEAPNFDKICENPMDNKIYVRRYMKGAVYWVGSLSQSYSAYDNTLNQKRHLKKIKNDDLRAAEIDFFRTLEHPHIAKLVEVMKFHNLYELYMEFCGDRTLSDVLEDANETDTPLTEQYIARIIKQVLQAVAYFHGEKVLHRSLKLNSVMVNQEDQETKIIDFSVAENIETRGVHNDLSGISPYYTAPEVLTEDNQHVSHHTYAADIWAVGIMLYKLATNNSSITDVKEKNRRQLLAAQESYFAGDNGFNARSEGLQSLIRQMLNLNPAARPTAVRCLKHGWFSNNAPDDKVTAVEEKTIFKNMKAFSKRGQLYAAMCNLAERELPCDTTDSAVKLFKNLDVDNIGILTSDQLKNYLTASNEWTSEEVKRLMNVITAKAVDGVITVSELTAACRNWSDQNNKAVFSVIFDKLVMESNVTLLSIDELSLVTQRDHSHNIVKLMKVIGTNKDGQITKEAFVKYMTA